MKTNSRFGLFTFVTATLLFAAGRVTSYADFSIFSPATTLATGSTIQLEVVGEQSSTNPIVTYQWSKDGILLTDDDRITGSQSPTLTILNAALEDSGTYTSGLSFLDGSQINLLASVQVIVVTEPQFQGPIQRTGTADDVIFQVNASGGLLSYQWLWQGQILPGATNSVLVLSNAYALANAGYYTVLVSNTVGTAVSDGPGVLFTKPTPSGTYQGLFYEDQARMESSGFIQFSLSAKNQRFTGKLVSGAKTYPFTGTFSLAHDATVTVQRPKTTPLLLTLQLLTDREMPRFMGQLGNSNWIASVSGNRLCYSSRNPAPQLGRYTLSLHATNIDGFTPSGDGYGVVNVRKDGTVTVSGQAADGTTFSQSCGLSQLGDWPLYVALYKKQGALLGWLRFTNQSNSSLKGSLLNWIKPSRPDKLYPDGFATPLVPSGSKYAAPTVTNAILRFTAGVATLSGGDLFVQNSGIWDFVKVTIQPPANFVADEGLEKLRLSINKSTGVLSGHFVNYATGRSTPIKGIVLQQQNYASGFFLSTNTAGAFSLVPNDWATR